MGRLFIIFDTETTGLAKQPPSELYVPASITNRGSEICQIGGIILDDRMVPLKLFCHYCDIVPAESSKGALETHGIHMFQVRKYLLGQYLPEVLMSYLPQFFAEDVIFVGYNVEFDLTMVAQSLANSPISFRWNPLKTTLVPKKGRHSIDVAGYMRIGSRYRKLSSFEEELKPLREAFLNKYIDSLYVETNCIDLLQGSWNQAHNAFFDALSTYILWGERLWKKKLI